MNKKHILIVYWGCSGGGSKFTAEIIKAIKNSGETKLYIAISDHNENLTDIQSIGLGIFSINLHSTPFYRFPIRLLELRKQLFDFIFLKRIQIVYCTMSHIFDLFFLDIFLRSGVKYVFTMHDALPHPGDNQLIRRATYQFEVRASDRIIVLSEHVKNQLLLSYGYDLSRITVTKHGIFNYGKKQTIRKYPVGRPLRLLFFGRIEKYKGLDLLIDAFNLLRKEHKSIELLIAGSGKASYLPTNINAFKGVQFDNRWIPDGEVERLLSKSDLVLAPYTEASQSGVIATAFGAGLPVIITPVGGLIEQVSHKNTGIISKDVSSPSFASAIELLITDPELYEHCAKSIVINADNKFSWAETAKDLEKTFSEVYNA